ncbi:MAG: TonB family protein [Candidatus Omnitrophota bacterium]|nr:TonB family protein [Candidatus Omnitrophota bacterium]MBU1929245.1 TonB family protein [Candidatus Omnitrophota bacterium]MBU2034372.1 TonB family protein [Candidatus Omnitrophota bacterium]MBU2221553.1 TonB family protein [Candidatus Omnitrophota bacterium]MBU2258099.1 TonB family protein [Candidatus Omnitrophota bacterium]
MFSEKILQITLIISLLVHAGFLFFYRSNLSIVRLENKLKKLEITYIKTLESVKKQLPKNEALNFSKAGQKPGLEKAIAPPPFIEKVEAEPLKRTPGMYSRNQAMLKPNFIKSPVVPLKKKISLPPVDSAKISNHSYLNYYQLVREQIRRSAYQNYSRAEIGEVYISFLISNDGQIRQMRLIDNKTQANQYLRETAMRSIREASPFPAFPKELSEYPQLSFNVIISFEIE